MMPHNGQLIYRNWQNYFMKRKRMNILWCARHNDKHQQWTIIQGCTTRSVCSHVFAHSLLWKISVSRVFFFDGFFFQLHIFCCYIIIPSAVVALLFSCLNWQVAIIKERYTFFASIIVAVIIIIIIVWRLFENSVNFMQKAGADEHNDRLQKNKR